MIKAILFDLGGTLVWYYERSEFPHILEQAITEVQNFLSSKGLLKVSSEAIWRRVEEENYEAKDNSVRPLEERLTRIFQLDNAVQSDELLLTICRLFMKPIFAQGQCYEDSLSVLRELRSRGFKTAIVSNTSWGSPSALWHEELARHGLKELVDDVVFCRDVGWRKPAKQIFQFALEKLHASPSECIFVGDEPNWDVAGARAVGMRTVLIDHRGQFQSIGEEPIRNLYELLTRIRL